MHKNDITGYIHSIETCGTVDGPGIRYVIFLNGCPLRCLYCHNPDTWKLKGEDTKKMTVSEVMSDIRKYKSYINFSNGGVTATGGDPLMQKDFVASLFKECKKENIHTALDTAGFIKIEQAEEVLNYTDLVLLDIKSINPYTFKKITGKEINKTLEFSNYLSKKNIKAWIRFVLVPGLSDNENEIEELAKYIKTLKNVEKMGLLPFHKMGEYKWKKLNIPYTLENTPPPTEYEIEKVKNIFKKHNIDVV